MEGRTGGREDVRDVLGVFHCLFLSLISILRLRGEVSCVPVNISGPIFGDNDIPSAKCHTGPQLPLD